MDNKELDKFLDTFYPELKIQIGTIEPDYSLLNPYKKYRNWNNRQLVSLNLIEDLLILYFSRKQKEEWNIEINYLERYRISYAKRKEEILLHSKNNKKEFLAIQFLFIAVFHHLYLEKQYFTIRAKVGIQLKKKNHSTPVYESVKRLWQILANYLNKPLTELSIDELILAQSFHTLNTIFNKWFI